MLFISFAKEVTLAFSPLNLVLNLSLISFYFSSFSVSNSIFLLRSSAYPIFSLLNCNPPVFVLPPTSVNPEIPLIWLMSMVFIPTCCLIFLSFDLRISIFWARPFQAFLWPRTSSMLKSSPTSREIIRRHLFSSFFWVECFSLRS